MFPIAFCVRGLILLMTRRWSDVPRHWRMEVYMLCTRRARQTPLSKQQKDAFEYANSINFTLNCKDNEMTESFWKIWEGYPNLKEIRSWWNKLESHFQVTPVGEALANAYIRGKEPSIPPMY